MQEYDFSRLRAFAENPDNHVTIGEEELTKFKQLYTLLVEKNKEYNLTSITEPCEAETKHFIDSLMAVDEIKRFTEGDSFSLIDIGCGAGFPGLPLKIVFPGAEFVMVDSVGKKIEFVKEAIEALRLTKIVTETDRAERLARTAYRESFDFCIARAVANLPVLLEYCLPFLRVGGHAILFKSGDYKEELVLAEPAVKVLGGGEPEVKEFTLPFTMAERSLIIIKKEKPTPEKYPRRAGKAAKAPIR